ncbi:MAG: hypothetical protein ACPGVG_14455, partial [Mycobacterium sp.]
LNQRRYAGSQAVELGDLIAHECKLLGIFPAVAADGRITFKPIRLPGQTGVFDVAITAWNTLTDDKRPDVERDAFGSLNMATIKTGYSHIDDEHQGRTYRVRDAYAVSSRPYGKDLQIEPKSSSTDPGYFFNPSAAKELVTGVLGILGRPYSVINVEVPLLNHDGTNLLTTAVVGSIVALTSETLPDSIDGVYGITAKRGLVIGRNWDLLTGRGILTLMLRDEPAAGYCPEVTVVSDAVVSGNQYDLVVTFEDPEGLLSTAPSGAVLTDFFVAGMELELMDWDSTSVTPQTCSIDTVTDGTNTLRVTFDSSPTISGTQYLRFADAGSATTDQEPFAFFADDSGRIAFASGDQSAKVFVG